MNLTLMALLIVFLLAVWLFVRSRQASKLDESGPATQPGGSNTAYHAVSIKYSSNACRAARDMADRRFLATAAPKLPLAECNVLECKCRFVHHKDRRASKDRRSPFGPSGFGAGTGRHNTEQRAGEERRERDDEDFF